jgi:hypothetical protein
VCGPGGGEMLGDDDKGIQTGRQPCHFTYSYRGRGSRRRRVGALVGVYLKLRRSEQKAIRREDQQRGELMLWTLRIHAST